MLKGFKYICHNKECEEANNVKVYRTDISKYDHNKKEVVSERDYCPTCGKLRVELKEKFNGFPTNTRGFRPNEGRG